MPSTTRSTFFTYPTKFGPVTIAADGTAVTAVSFGEQNLPGDRQPTALTTEAANQIMAYLAGQRSAFTVPMCPEGSAFQQEVWKAAANIPYGHTTTARALAETLGGYAGQGRDIQAFLERLVIDGLVELHLDNDAAREVDAHLEAVAPQRRGQTGQQQNDGNAVGPMPPADKIYIGIMLDKCKAHDGLPR